MSKLTKPARARREFVARCRAAERLATPSPLPSAPLKACARFARVWYASPAKYLKPVSDDYNASGYRPGVPAGPAGYAADIRVAVKKSW